MCDGDRIDDEGKPVRGSTENADGAVLMRHGCARAVLWRRTCRTRQSVESDEEESPYNIIVCAKEERDRVSSSS